MAINTERDGSNKRRTEAGFRAASVAAQAEWIADRGGSLEAYRKLYGNAPDDPERGDLIWAADVAEFDRLLERWRNGETPKVKRRW